jgi:hypothetical protein
MRLLIGSAAKRARDTMDTDDDQDYTEQQQQQDEEVRVHSAVALTAVFTSAGPSVVAYHVFNCVISRI